MKKNTFLQLKKIIPFHIKELPDTFTRRLIKFEFGLVFDRYLNDSLKARIRKKETSGEEENTKSVIPLTLLNKRKDVVITYP